MFSAVPNRFKYRQNACFRDVVFKIVSEVIRVVSNSVRLHALSCRNVEKTLRASSCHGARTACALRVHGAHIALTAFCSHSEVVEITGRVLISQLRYEPMFVTMHQSSALLQPCSNLEVTTPGVPPTSSPPPRLHHPAYA